MVSYFVRTREEARFWVPEDLAKEIKIPVVRRGYHREWSDARLLADGKAGAFRVTYTMEGVSDPKDGENGVQFDADGTTEEADGESHPDLPYLLQEYDGRIEDGKLIFEPTLVLDDGSDTEIKNDLFGFKRYLVAGLTWTRTYVTTRPPASVTRMLGKIDSPPRATDGYLPDLPGKRNWLKVVGKPSWKGNTWKVTESWMMSADGGWNRDVYR